MRSRSWFLVGLFLALALSPAFAGDSGWVLYTHPDKLMSVWFPGKPTEGDQEGPSPVGRMRVKVATFIDGDRAFVATAGIYPDKTKFDVKGALARALDKTLVTLKGRIVAQKSMTLDGVQGTEVQFTAPGPYKKPLLGVARVFASADPPITYVVMALQMDGKPDPRAPKFLASLHLGKKVETRP